MSVKTIKKVKVAGNGKDYKNRKEERRKIMNCPICGTEMKDGYSVHPGLGGFIRVVNLDVYQAEKIPLLQLSVCPKCGKIEIFVDVKKIKW